MHDVFLRAPQYPTDFPSRLDITSKSTQQNIIEWVRLHKIQCVILDPLNHLHELNENDTQEMTAVTAGFDAIKDATGAALIVIHHPAKGHGGGKQRSRGSSVLYSYVDAEVSLSAKAQALRMEWSKLRYDACPQAITLTMGTDGLLRVRAATSAPSRTVARRERELTLLRAHPGPVLLKDLCDALKEAGNGAAASTVSADLKKHQEDGTVRHHLGGFYEAIRPSESRMKPEPNVEGNGAE